MAAALTAGELSLVAFSNAGIAGLAAAPISPNVSVVPQRDIQNVRMVCNEDGRCWREHRERRVIIQGEGRDSYAYGPRERYERRSYEDRGGIGIHAPGVSVGIGTDRY